MAARIVAGVVVIAGLAVLVWAMNGGGTETTEPFADAPVTTTDASADAEGDTASAPDEPTPEPTTFPEPENYGPRMDLVDIDEWLQTDATSIEEPS